MRDAGSLRLGPHRAEPSLFGSGRRFSGRSGLEFLDEAGDRVAQLSAVLLPIGDAVHVEDEAFGLAGGHRVVEADAFNEAAVAAGAGVANVNVEEGALLGAAAGKSNYDLVLYL